MYQNEFNNLQLGHNYFYGVCLHLLNLINFIHSDKNQP